MSESGPLSVWSERDRGRACVAGAIVLAALAFSCSLALASVPPTWRPAMKADMSALSPPSEDVALVSVSCGSADDCSAVGDYYDGSGQQGVVVTETDGSWSAAKADLSALSPAGDPNVRLNSVSCASAGNCSAVGYYADSSSRTQGLLLTEAGGRWSAARADLSALNPVTDPYFIVDLSAVSCASAGNCSAVGNYVEGSDQNQGLLLTQTGGRWSAAKADLSTLSPAPGVVLNLSSVSCASAGNCSAVGNYQDTSSHQHGLLLTQTSGSWSAATADLSALSPAVDPRVVLSAVSCASAGNCSAVGTYFDSSGLERGLLLTQTDGRWSAATADLSALSPSTDPHYFLNLSSVSCASVGNCSAVGHYPDSSGHPQGLLLTQMGGRWSAAKADVSALTPATDRGVMVDSVSCASAGNCSAIGSYNDPADSEQGLLLTQTAGRWSAATADASALSRFPISPGSIPAILTAVLPSSISCASAGDCAAVGQFLDDGLNADGLLLGTTASPALSLSAPVTGTAGRAIAPSSLSATLAGGFSPTGAIGFRVFGPRATPPSSCASGGTTVGSATVNRKASYTPTAGFVPPSGGIYYWYATYAGDTANDPAVSACAAGMPRTIVAAVGGAPNNRMTLTSTADRKTGAITFRASVSDPGRFRFTLTFPNGTFGVIAAKNTKCKTGQVRLKGRCRAAMLSFGSGTKTVAASGIVRITVVPSAAALKALKQAAKHNHGVRVTATVTYRSARGGVPVTHTLTILDKLSKTNHKRHKQ